MSPEGTDALWRRFFVAHKAVATGVFRKIVEIVKSSQD
jgi:hypothetical protein